MRELDVGDVVYHEITNQVFWVSGNYYVGHREDMLLNMECVWCINKKHNGTGILIPRSNLTYIPLPKHINSDVVIDLRSIHDLISYVYEDKNEVTEQVALTFMTKLVMMIEDRPNAYKQLDQYRL